MDLIGLILIGFAGWFAWPAIFSVSGPILSAKAQEREYKRQIKLTPQPEKACG